MNSCVLPKIDSNTETDETDCCSIPIKTNKTKAKAKCSDCGRESKTVGKITLVHMLKNEYLINLDGEHFYYCENPDCDIVYFSETPEMSYSKDKIRIPVGIKEKEGPQHVCYCFDYTVQSISNEIKYTGKSEAAKDIAQKVKEKLCACEVNNPAGKCCLGNINKTIKQEKERYSSIS